LFCPADERRFTGSSDASGQAINVYDGEWHIFNLNITNDQGAPDKVKMKIVKNSAGSITSFTMFMCKQNGTMTQTEYTDQTIDGQSFAMHGIGHFADSQWQGSHQVDVTGTLNSSGVFTQKTISSRNVGADVNFRQSELAGGDVCADSGSF